MKHACANSQLYIMDNCHGNYKTDLKWMQPGCSYLLKQFQRLTRSLCQLTHEQPVVRALTWKSILLQAHSKLDANQRPTCCSPGLLESAVVFSILNHEGASHNTQLVL